VVVYLSDDLLGIINQYGNKNRKPNDFVFPFMQSGLTLLEQLDLVNYIRRIINDSMAMVKEALQIDKKITTIVSRHTFSTHLKRAGAYTELIQEALGHTDKRTTGNYLDSFENELKKEYALRLTQCRKG
jgi:integrase/recombinase XerD